ncbi:hypothetical protein M3Y98_00651800 [Aphelenchoides besseyi]|nr:hypothetical protein M3Y98_00651800 [Aphelenchoides besseyi]KAI6208686.1 hypothetical protein M3Y96_00141200 [Aphelenchoides besseyi]
MATNTRNSTAEIQNKLLARQIVQTLSAHPDQLVDFLNQQPSVFSQNFDSNVQKALRVLRTFYKNLKTEIITGLSKPVDQTSTLRFLAHDRKQTCESLVEQYANSIAAANHQEVRVSSKRSSKRNVSQNIPRFPSRFNEHGSNSSSLITSSQESSYSSEIRRITKSSRSSSRRKKNERKTEEQPIRENEIRRIETIDQSSSPIQLAQRTAQIQTEEMAQPTAPTTSKTSTVEEISVVSMAVQTDALKIDAATRTYDSNSPLTSTPNSTSLTSTSKTTSSMISSDHSLGQISFRRATMLTTQYQFRMNTFSRDGSVCAPNVRSTYNSPFILEHSTPVRKSPSVREAVPSDLAPANRQQSTSGSHLVLGSSSDSPLIVQEESVQSSTKTEVKPRIADIAEDLVDQSEELTEEDVSTLNQISPLPTG